jgi:hypothetical protein
MISRIPLSVIQLLELLLGDHWVSGLHPTINLSVIRTTGHLSFSAEKEVKILRDVVLSTNRRAQRWLGESCGAERVVVEGGCREVAWPDLGQGCKSSDEPCGWDT